MAIQYDLSRLKQKNPVRDQKIIILDSPDGTGKTNIAHGLSLDLKIPYFKMKTEHEYWRQGKFKESLEFDQTYSVEFIKQTKCNVIIDRAYPAEWVYSQVFNRSTNMEVLEQVDLEFAKLGAYIVIPVRHDYSKSREDEVVPNNMHQKLHDKYMEFRRWTRCSTITIYVDSFKEDLKREIDLLRPEFDWGSEVNWVVNKTIDITVEQRDIDDLFTKRDIRSQH